VLPAPAELEFDVGNGPDELEMLVLGLPDTDDCPVTGTENPVLEDGVRPLEYAGLV
jgi:hypothetical protein